MEFIYDLTKLEAILNIGSEEPGSYKLYDIMQDATVCALSATTNKSTEDIVSTAFDVITVNSSMYSIIEDIRKFIKDNGYPTTESLLKYAPLHDWCEKNNVRDIAGALEEEFGSVSNCVLEEVIPTLESLRKDYL